MVFICYWKVNIFSRVFLCCNVYLVFWKVILQSETPAPGTP